MLHACSSMFGDTPGRAGHVVWTGTASMSSAAAVHNSSRSGPTGRELTHVAVGTGPPHVGVRFRRSTACGPRPQLWPRRPNPAARVAPVRRRLDLAAAAGSACGAPLPFAGGASDAAAGVEQSWPAAGRMCCPDPARAPAPSHADAGANPSRRRLRCSMEPHALCLLLDGTSAASLHGATAVLVATPGPPCAPSAGLHVGWPYRAWPLGQAPFPKLLPAAEPAQAMPGQRLSTSSGGPALAQPDGRRKVYARPSISTPPLRMHGGHEAHGAVWAMVSRPHAAARWGSLQAAGAHLPCM